MWLVNATKRFHTGEYDVRWKRDLYKPACHFIVGGTKPMIMKSPLPVIDSSRLYSRQEVAAMFSLTDFELFSYVSESDGLLYETDSTSPYPRFRGSELLRFFVKTHKLCQDGCRSMKMI